jgi:hypothetical protein
MLYLGDEEIRQIFKNHLKVASRVMSIDSMFSLKRRGLTKYDPYYQRNYVWDSDKATYFIESILLGTEVPPLVLFESGSVFEVIDGRQRFETIQKFLDDKLVLSKKGLSALTSLAKSHFSDFEEQVRNTFLDTKLRIIEFSVVNEPRLTDRQEDSIKKEIFRRYNSGITPLKNAEIENARYIDDEITKYFKAKLKQNPETYNTLLDLFFQDRDKESGHKSIIRERVMQKIRDLVIMHQMPISYYANSSGRKNLVERLYAHMATTVEDVDVFYANFTNKLSLLTRIKDETDINNRLVYECLFWSFSILEVEKGSSIAYQSAKTLETLASHVSANPRVYETNASHFSKSIVDRYTYTGEVLASAFGIPMDVYLISGKRRAEQKAELQDPETSHVSLKLQELEALRLNKPDAESTTIEDIHRRMDRRRFLVRPSYQRGEAINKAKSSGLIESILLDIQLPPLFVYKREDGVSEVVDGQQRLLSILGYIGRPFMDENGKPTTSEKNNYALSKLRILTDINGKRFSDLSPTQQEKILTFNLSVVNIDERVNPKFSPVDLFLRLNNKPYPIRENTFEMWNSYVDKELITSIKAATARCDSWFYLRVNNNRMDNEQLYTSLSYLDCKAQKAATNAELFKVLDMYEKATTINIRIKSKNDVTAMLNAATDDPQAREDILKGVKNTEKFISKLRTLLVDPETKNSASVDEYLIQELNAILDLKGRHVFKRTYQAYYLLWFILHRISIEMVRHHRLNLKSEIHSLMEYVKNTSSSAEDQALTDFRERVLALWQKYSVQQRLISLTEVEKMDMLARQSNICPICNLALYWGEEVEIDHRVSLAIGGPDSMDNLQVVHKTCNRQKRTRLVN